MSDPGENNVPRLPVRGQEPVFVWCTEFADAAEAARFERALSTASGWRDAVPAAVPPALMRKPEAVRLAG